MEPAVPSNKVLCFCIPAPQGGPFYSSGDVVAVACDEEGKTLSTHYCSNATFARGDILRDSHQAAFKARYPGGYETKWVDVPPSNWENNPKVSADGLAAEIYAALHLPQYEWLVIQGGTPVKQMYLERIAAIIERNSPLPPADSVTHLRERLDHIHSIMCEKSNDGHDIELGSTAFKSVTRWADWRRA